MNIFLGNGLNDECYKNASIIDFNLQDDEYLVVYTTCNEEYKICSMDISNILGIFDFTFIQIHKDFTGYHF